MGWSKGEWARVMIQLAQDLFDTTRGGAWERPVGGRKMVTYLPAVVQSSEETSPEEEHRVLSVMRKNPSGGSKSSG